MVRAPPHHHRCQAPGTPGHREGHWSGNNPGYRRGAPQSRAAGGCRYSGAAEQSLVGTASVHLEAGHSKSWLVWASRIYPETASDTRSEEVCMASRWVEVGLEEALCSESEAWHTFLSAEVADNWRPVLAEAGQEVGSSHWSQSQDPEARTRPRGCRTPHPPDCTGWSNL